MLLGPSKKKLNCFYSQGDLPECSMDKISRWKFFLAKSTASVFSSEPAWLAYVRAGTSPSQAGSEEKTEAVDLAAILDF